MSGYFSAFKRTARKGRTKTYNMDNQRTDLHPRVRYLLHRQSRTVIGMFAPFIIGTGVLCTSLLYYVPQEKQTFVYIILKLGSSRNIVMFMF